VHLRRGCREGSGRRYPSPFPQNPSGGHENKKDEGNSEGGGPRITIVDSQSISQLLTGPRTPLEVNGLSWGVDLKLKAQPEMIVRDLTTRNLRPSHREKQ